MIGKLKLFVLYFLFSFSISGQAQDSAAPSAPPPPSTEDAMIEKLWGKEFAQCFMNQSQYEEFEKKWTRYRVLTRARYNILAKSYFADKTPKLDFIEIDKAFQYQALEPMTCPGMTEQDRWQGVQKEVEASLAVEGLTLADLKKLFDLDDVPKKLEDYLDLFNDPSLISMPYGFQDGYDQLFRSEWVRTNKTAGFEYTYNLNGQTKTIKFTPQDLRTIDGIARTMWSELSSCEAAPEGHYQMLARLLIDRMKACEGDVMVSRRHCRADPQGRQLPIFEEIIAAPIQFDAWNPASYAVMEVTNTAGKKLGKSYKSDIGFHKMLKPNPLFRKTLCPAMEDVKTPLAENKLSSLKSAYAVALELYRDPEAFAKRWQWPKNVRNGIRFYSYGVSFEKGTPKSVHSILDTSLTPPKEYDFKKSASASCPTPYLYEKR